MPELLLSGGRWGESVRMPKDPETREKWRQCLFGSKHCTFGRGPQGEPRSFRSFQHPCRGGLQRARRKYSRSHGFVRRLPNQSEEAMKELAKGALGKELRWKAMAERHRRASFNTKVALVAAREKALPTFTRSDRTRSTGRLPLALVVVRNPKPLVVLVSTSLRPQMPASCLSWPC